ncbi:uncharacterized protein LOC135500411 [Lineus longissimus]|uniref:uncharacterized protein LOC135500411 n=1 Tax=Lineus longissimus TaxID=88925 RepID=UPI00315DD60E
MNLFATCPVCSSESTRTIKKIGTFISVSQRCVNKHCGFERTWNSQPMYNRITAGNVLLSSAILFSGAIPSKILQVMRILGCQSIHRNTFFVHQSRLLWPAVQDAWRQEQREILDAVKEADYSLVVGGDGRSDTPGHSAKYGCYTLMDLETKKILDIELVQIWKKKILKISKEKDCQLAADWC